MSDRLPGRDGPSVDPTEPLRLLCAVTRSGHRAAAVSIATITPGGLRYVAADGEGADEIVGTVLSPGEGLGGFVAATGQSLAVRDATSDPRFARHIAERTGYVPDALQIVPIVDPAGDVAGVVSMLDRGHHGPPDDQAPTLATVASIAAALVPTRSDGDGIDPLVERLNRLDDDDRRAVVTAIESMLTAVER